MGSPSAGGCLALAALVMQCLLLPHVSAHPHPPTAATPTHAETAATTSSSSQDAVAEEAGRVLGSSVVTSVSVIADGEGVGGVSNGTSTRTYNPEPPARSQQGTKKRPQPQAAQGTVAAPAARPATVASPAGLMSPDRYEFYTFDETGDLVRRHMTLDEIKSLLAGGDGDMGDTPIATFYHGPVPAPPRAPTRAPAHHHAQGMLAGLEDPEDALEDAVKGVQDVVNNVQNVLKSQLAASKNKLPAYIRPPPAHGAPNPAEAAATWAMILPGIMDGGLPPKPPTPVPTSPTPASPQRPTTIKTHGKKPLTSQSSTTAKKPLNKKTTTTTAVPAASKEEPPVRFTLAPTTEQDIVDTLYTLVSSSPGLKHTASNNASDLPPLRPRPSQPPPRPATPRPQRPATPQRPAITAPHRVAAKPHPAKPVATKPAPSKTASSKPGARPVPKPVTKPFRPAEQVQQRRPIPQQDHAESMVQIVTVPRPVTTTTMAPFVTFIPTELSETSVTTASPSSPPTSPLTSPTTSPPPSPVTSQLTTFATRRPPAISYTYRGTTTTSTETPTFTETVSSADLDMDSRTTAEEEDAESTVTTTTPARTSPAGTSPTLTPTTGSSTSRATEPPTTSLPTTTFPTIWTTNPPTTTFTPVRAVTRDPPNRITTQFATTLLPAEDETTATSEQATDATPVPAPVTTVPVDSKPPVRYTEILTRVPASALVTKAVPEDDAEQTSTIISTLPTTERDEVNALTTAFSKASDDTTEVADDEDDDSAEQVSEESIDDSAETEGTTKLYLKISSSENNGFLFSSSTTEASAADMVTPTMEVETKPTAVTSSETFVTDQSAASTEHRGTTASLPASSEEAESRTESDLETTVDEETSASLTTKTPLTTETEAYTTNQPTSTAVPTTTSTAVPTTTSTAVPTTTSAALTSQSTAGPTSTSTKAASQTPTQYSAASTTRTTTLTTRTTPLTTPSELSLESSNILTSQVDAPQTPQASGLKMVPTPATSVPTSLSVEVDLNKVDKLDNKVDIVEASSPASQPQPLWTRVPVVSSAEDEDGVKPVDGVEEAVKVYHSPQPSAVDLQAAPQEHLGLEAATATLDPDVRSFVNLCNELAFQMWMAVKERSASTTSRSIVMSPFAATSTLAMVFLGARGPTSGQMNDVLRLDDMVSFNPHQVMWNVTEALVRPKTKNTGVATAALVRELYSDKNKGKLLDFYKERAQQFYEGHVEEITFRNSGDLVRRKTNLLVKRQTRGRVQEYMRGASLALRGPLAAFGANIFETDCTGASTEGRDGEMHFVVVPSSRQRRLVPVPAAVWRSGFLAGYDPALDATAVAVGPADATFSTVLVLPGQQGHVAPGDGLSRLEQRLLESRGPSARWARLLRTLLPRPGLELQVPRFSHRSVLNMSEALQRMGLDELFSSEHADLRGLNGVANDLHLSDVVQLNTFSTCGERAVDSRHHVEFFPTSPLASPGRRAARGRRLRPKVAETDDPRIEVHPDNVGKDRDSYYARVGDALEAAEARGSSGLTSSEEVMASEDASSSSSSISSSSREARTFQRIADFEDPDLMKVPLALRPRQARIPEAARLRFDRPFLFFVRHNPTGVLLHMGRFNPRLLP